MQRRNWLITGSALAAALALLPAHAQDKATQQADVKTKAMQALQDFYKADPKLKDAVAKAPGYAVFTTFGLSFGLGGAGGKGVAHDSKSGKDVFMNIAQASAGLQNANAKAGAGNLTGGRLYALTKAGLQVGAAVSGVKAWKDKDLN